MMKRDETNVLYTSADNIDKEYVRKDFLNMPRCFIARLNFTIFSIKGKRVRCADLQ